MVGLNPSQRLCILLLLLSLIMPTFSRDWQGTGNMSESNMTEIQTAINNNAISLSFSSTQIDAVAKTISTRLNQAWSASWYVMIVKSSEPYDTVLYGYAFKDHWMWTNGVPIPSSQYILSYLIWKDYNCDHWSTAGNLFNTRSTFSEAQISQMRRFSFTGLSTDAWTVTYNFIREISSRVELINGFYGIILSQHPNATYCGYFCLINNSYMLSSSLEKIGETSFIGSYFLFQTR